MEYGFLENSFLKYKYSKKLPLIQKIYDLKLLEIVSAPAIPPYPITSIIISAE